MNVALLIRFMNKIRNRLAPRRVPVRIRMMSDAEMIIHIRQRAAQRDRM